MTEFWFELFQAISFSQSNRHTLILFHISFFSLPWHSREQAVSGDSPGIMAPFHSALPYSLPSLIHSHTTICANPSLRAP